MTIKNIENFLIKCHQRTKLLRVYQNFNLIIQKDLSVAYKYTI